MIMKQWPLFCFLVLNNMLFSAGPLLHIYLAQQWITISKKYTKEQEALFISGTLFPDIRYSAGLERQQTHEAVVTLETVVQESNAFKAGMHFHCWVDNFREETTDAEPQGLALIGEDHEAHLSTFLKLIEDEIIYETLDHDYYSTVLKTISPEEYEVAASLGIVSDILVKWHQHLIDHVKTRPTDMITALAQHQKNYLIHIPAILVQKWSTLLPVYAASDTLKNYVYTMINMFVTDLKRCNYR